jgi:hypothetical protein
MCGTVMPCYDLLLRNNTGLVCSRRFIASQNTMSWHVGMRVIFGIIKQFIHTLFIKSYSTPYPYDVIRILIPPPPWGMGGVDTSILLD